MSRPTRQTRSAGYLERFALARSSSNTLPASTVPKRPATKAKNPYRSLSQNDAATPAIMIMVVYQDDGGPTRCIGMSGWVTALA